MDRPLHLLSPTSASLPCKSSHDLINYARAHNSLWLHTEVSSMNNLMIPLSLGGGPYTNRQHWVLQVPQSTQMWVLVATLSWTINKHLTSVMNISQTQSTSTSIAWQYNSNVEVTPKGLIIKQVIGTTSSTSQNPHINQILIMQLFEDWSNAIKLGSKEVWSKCYLPCWWSVKPRDS